MQLSLVSSLPASYYNELERLVFFNPCQAHAKSAIVKALELVERQSNDCGRFRGHSPRRQGQRSRAIPIWDRARPKAIDDRWDGHVRPSLQRRTRRGTYCNRSALFTKETDEPGGRHPLGACGSGSGETLAWGGAHDPAIPRGQILPDTDQGIDKCKRFHGGSASRFVILRLLTVGIPGLPVRFSSFSQRQECTRVPST